MIAVPSFLLEYLDQEMDPSQYNSRGSISSNTKLIVSTDNMSSPMNNNSPLAISVSGVGEAQAENRQVPSDDLEISFEERNRSLASSNATDRKSWQLMLFSGIVTVVTSLLVIIFVWVGMSRSSNATGMSPIRESGIPTTEFPAIHETPRFGSPEFMEELRTVVGVDPLPDTPQLGALEWMASDDLELWDYESISVERLTQRYALVVFHIATGRWNTKGGWATPSGARQHECYWPGVYCDRDNAVVVSLRLDTFVGTLQGSIPSDIFLLSTLERLSLVNNMLTGDIPDAIYSLSNLYSLRLSNSTLSATLSSSIGNLSQLLTLDLMGGGFVGSVPTELGVLPRLRRLDLSRNELVGTIPSQLGDLSRLEEFFVQDNNLKGEVPAKMCALRSLGLDDFRVDCNTSVVCEVPQCCTVCY